ncbi:MAG: membrane dipeptidase [Planctomycetota bacterium]
MLLFDGHLDLAMNALDHERDQTWPIGPIRTREAGGVADDRGTATVSLDELRQGGCGVVLSTLIARSKPWIDAARVIHRHDLDYPYPSMAYASAMGQLAYYRLLQSQGHLRILTTAEQLKQHVTQWDADETTTPIGMILTMEGADPIVEPEQLHHWHDLGLRTLMLAHFGKSHYAQGTPPSDPHNQLEGDGPLSVNGQKLLPIMHELGMPLDLTHTSDQSFAEAADLFGGRIYSSHTACRALRDIPRNHSDEQLKQIIERGGVIGLPLFNFFLKSGYAEDSPKDSVRFSDVADHIDHICQIAGDTRHVAIGSDADGGFGREHMPAEIDSHRDLSKLADTLAGRGYSADDTALILGGNWERFFAEVLP